MSDKNIPTYDITDLIRFEEQRDGSVTIEPRERPLEKDIWPTRWDDPTYLGDGPWGA